MSDTAAAPPRPMFSWTITANAEVRHELRGPDTPELSTLLCACVAAGAAVRVRTPRARYVLTGPQKTLDRLVELVAAEPGASEAGFVLRREIEPPAGEVFLQSDPVRVHPYRRATVLQGAFSTTCEHVARAIDYRLIPTFLGSGRWSVTGLTSLQVRWISEVVLLKPMDETLKSLGLSSVAVAREDRDGTLMATNPAQTFVRTRVRLDEDGNLVGSETSEYDEPQQQH